MRCIGHFFLLETKNYEKTREKKFLKFFLEFSDTHQNVRQGQLWSTVDVMVK